MKCWRFKMPLPLLIWGAAAAATGYAGKKAIDTIDDNSLAKHTNEWAESSYNAAMEELEDARQNTQASVESLGELKFELWEKAMIPFSEAFAKIKNIEINKSANDYSGSLPAITQSDFLNIQAQSLEMKEVVSGGVMALGSGGLAGLASYGAVSTFAAASTGTSIAGLSGIAAQNATLAWLGGGSLATGGGGIALGTAVLGGLVAAPVLIVGGMIMASKAEAAKEDAFANLAQAELAIEEMKTAVVVTNGIKLRFDEMKVVLEALHLKFAPMLDSLEKLVETNIDYSSYSEDDKKGLMICASIAKTIKNLIDCPMLDEDGTVTTSSAESVSTGTSALKTISDDSEMSQLNQRIEPVIAKKTFEELLEPFIERLNVGSYMYAGSALYSSKVRKKANNAVKEYANDDGYEPFGELLVLIDTTVFGSAKDGFYITEDEIYAKELMDDPVSFKISDIERIKHRKSDREVIINGHCISYTHTEMNLAMEAIVNCIQEFIDQ